MCSIQTYAVIQVYGIYWFREQEQEAKNFLRILTFVRSESHQLPVS